MSDDSASSSGSESEDNVPAVKQPPKKKAKVEKTGPKKPLSAYMFFCKSERAVLKAENPEASFGELGKLLGTKWKKMGPDGKTSYNSLAAKDKERYAEEGGGPAKATGSRSKAATKKDKTGPKRPLSAYMFFSKEIRPVLKAEDTTLSFAGLGKAIGAKWKECEGDDKAKFVELAAADKQRYKDEVENEKTKKVCCAATPERG